MLYAIIFSVICFLCAAFGASIVFFIRKTSKKIDCFLHAFSSGIMLASGIFSLIIPSIEYAEQFKIKIAVVLPVCFIIVGIMFYLLDRTSNASQGRVNMLAIMLGVGLHNIPEGICIGVAFATASAIASEAVFMSAVLISIGIAIQNIPEGTSIAFPLYCMGVSKIKAFLCSTAVAFIEVISCIIFYFVGTNNFTLLPYMLAFAGAVMLVIAVCDLMPEAVSKHKTYAMLALVSGFVLMMTLILVLE